ncbi:glutamine amidotransferase (plasmid) [Rhodococcus pyridinivorans SB3094]|uniref:Glutamine amidotransferase n=1 Tax=Rhodococcus pyridinivorans SB3094 TaxID=1435356 RepID=V9XPV3_9NOCA|nr:DJ-1/PfpI family protein [Rhodococcus pyridinivorans]AHD24040.1 glutamine amidotransferase [Rhodococcus pyridinivorans SB3094]
MTRVLMIAGDAAETLETIYPYQRLVEEGYEVHVGAPTKKKIQLVVHDFEEGFDTHTEKLGYLWPADIAFADVRPEEYTALVIPGGRAPEYLRYDTDVRRIVDHFVTTRKLIAFQCHGPLILAASGALKGRHTTGWPTIAADLEAAGAQYIDEEVVIDDNLVSGLAWPANPAWMRQVINLLNAQHTQDHPGS